MKQLCAREVDARGDGLLRDVSRLRVDELCWSVVWADPLVIASAPPAPIVAVEAKEADAVVVETVAMELMDPPMRPMPPNPKVPM
jgi:hypothetical protein